MEGSAVYTDNIRVIHGRLSPLRSQRPNPAVSGSSWHARCCCVPFTAVLWGPASSCFRASFNNLHELRTGYQAKIRPSDGYGDWDFELEFW